MCLCVHMHRAQAWTSVLTAVWAHVSRELALLSRVGGSSLALLGRLLERWTALCMGLEGATRWGASGGGEGDQPGIAAADQRLPCICSSLNLPHVGAGT